jgi:hypothetical protein
MHQQPFQYQMTLAMDNFHEITNKKNDYRGIFLNFSKKIQNFEKQGSIP